MIVLGADRVGKSMIVANTKKLIESAGQTALVWHFSQVKPYHHSPIDQFLDAFGRLENLIAQNKKPDYLLIDRFVSDTLFYEPYRNRFKKLDPSWAFAVESRLDSYSDVTEYLLLKKQWDNKMIERHVEEITKENSNASQYWIDLNIKVRKKEHRDYYVHTEFFLQNLSLFGHRILPDDPELNLLKAE
jgi:hypothetical protein